tara:strand:- start:1023 stop:1484 length:462 start_codon:yes stop_codon:yes gene_type:complete
MSVYKATSWGRTRRPKQLTDGNAVPDFQGKTTGTSVEIVGNTTHFANDLDSAIEGRNGYATENQRFLHLFVKHSAGVNKTVQVYGYNYAFGEWAPLFISLGNATMTQVICGTGTTGGQGQLHIIDVSGVDRVGFFSAASDAPDQSTRAAFTTF